MVPKNVLLAKKNLKRLGVFFISKKTHKKPNAKVVQQLLRQAPTTGAEPPGVHTGSQAKEHLALGRAMWDAAVVTAQATHSNTVPCASTTTKALVPHTHSCFCC